MKQVNYYSERGSSVPWWSRIFKKANSVVRPYETSSNAFHRFGDALPRPATKDSFYNLPIGTRPNLIIGALLIGAMTLGTQLGAQGMAPFSPQWPGVGSISGSNHTIDYLIENCLYNPNANIKLDGNLNDWLHHGRYYPADAYDAPGDKNVIDFLDAWMAHDDDYVYLAYTSDGKIILNEAENIYLDTDWNHTTGYSFGGVGADYLIQGNLFYKYNGTGSNFAWTLIGAVEHKAYGCQVEMRFHRSWIGNPDRLRFVMQADNTVFGGNIIDLFPDRGALSHLHGGEYFCYRFQSAKAIKNIAPFAAPNTYTTLVNTPVQTIIHKFDANGDPLTFHFATNVSHGVLTPDGPDAFIYTPNTNFVGTDSFSFFVNDGLVNSNTATVTIHVQGPAIGGPGGCISNPLQVPLKIDGSLTDWSTFTGFGIDPDDPDDHINRVDWRRGWMAHSSTSLYIGYENGSAIGSDFNWGFTIYLDTDTNTLTGFRGGSDELGLGVDYMIQSRHVFVYTGTGTNWAWDYVGTIVSGVHGEFVELAIPRAFIGNPTSRMHVVFGGMNKAFPGGSGIDYYPDDAVTARNCFCYDFAPPAKLSSGKGSRNTTTANGVYIPVELASQSTDILFNTPEALRTRVEGSNSSDDTLISLDWTAGTGTPVTIQYSTDLSDWNNILTFETQNGDTAFVAKEFNEIPNAFFRTVISGKISESSSAQ